jgi:hypothetical protein
LIRIATVTSVGNTYTEVGELKPDNEKALESVVPGEVVQNDAEAERLEEVEEAEDDPVSQPLNVILGARALNGADREVSGQSKADEVGGGRSERVESVRHGEKSDGTNSDISLGHVGALLGGVHDRVFRKLDVANVSTIGHFQP